MNPDSPQMPVPDALLRPPAVADRREFLRSAARLSIAGALGGLVLAAANRAGASCRRPFACGQCPVYGGCDLPKAMNYRENEIRWQEGARAGAANGLRRGGDEEGRP